MPISIRSMERNVLLIRDGFRIYPILERKRGKDAAEIVDADLWKSHSFRNPVAICRTLAGDKGKYDR